MKTIARTATRRVATIKATHRTCVSHLRRNDYDSAPSDPAYAWDQVERGDAKLTDNGDGTYTIRTHGTEWYVLTETEPEME